MVELSNKELHKLQMVELDLMKDFSFLCLSLNLRFQPTFGTLLGAIRHNGFIPWDDDVDLAMFYDDYVKLKKHADSNGQIGNGLFIQTISTDKHYVLTWLKIRKPAIKLREERTHKESMAGVFLDVFPIINFPKSNSKQKRIIRKIRFYTSTASIYTSKSSFLKRVICGIASIFLKPRFCIKKVEKILETTHRNNSNSGCSFLLSHNAVIPTEWISSTEKINFDGLEIEVPIGYDNLLKTMYGDYLKYPPKQEQIHSHYFEELELPGD